MSDAASGAGVDRVIRAMTDDGAFRVMAIRSTETVRGCVAAQDVRGIAAAQLGEVLTAAVLVRETMAPPCRVQILLRDADDNLIVGDSFPEGRTRGLVRARDEVLGVGTGPGGSVQVIRSLPGRPPHQGIVDSDQPGGITEAIMLYFKRSEQIETFVGIGCVIEDDAIVAAGGYVVQLLPELTDPPLEAMRRRLGAFESLDAALRSRDADAEWLLAALLGDSEYSLLAEDPVHFACGCGPDKAVQAVAVLGEQEVREMLAAGEPVRVTCDYCREVYEAGPDDFRKILGGEGD